MSTAGEKYFFISSLAKGLKVLELLAENESLSVTAVANHLGLNRATSHRFLATLQELGYVEKSPDNRYHLSFKMLRLGRKAADRFEIRHIARPVMSELSSAFNETINLGYMEGNEILHIDKIDSPEILRMDSPIGSRAPAYCTALGKAILAYLPQERIFRYLADHALKPLGPKTITDPAHLLKELEEIRIRGYSIDDEELSEGLRCVGAPIFDHTGLPRYSISVAGPSARFSRRRIEKIRQALQAACNRLSEKLGHPSN